MVDDEEGSIGWRLATSVEAANWVFMEEDVDPKCGEAQVSIDFRYESRNGVFFFPRQSSEGDFERPSRHFG